MSSVTINMPVFKQGSKLTLWSTGPFGHLSQILTGQTVSFTRHMYDSILMANVSVN